MFLKKILKMKKKKKIKNVFKNNICKQVVLEVMFKLNY